MNNCVISGIGLVTPIGCNTAMFWDNLINNRSNFIEKPLFDDPAALQTVATVNDSYLSHDLSGRQLKKLDRFTIFSIAAAKESLQKANLIITDEIRYDIGIFLGNAFGGWGYVENQMYQLSQGDLNSINSYVATAWFPAAPQGEISILLRVGGYSKTFSAEKLSAGYAFEHACYLIKNNQLNYALVGGSEAPLSGLVYNSCITSSLIEQQPNNINKLSEGAAMFLIESLDSAQKRGSKIYSHIAGIGIGNNLLSSITACLSSTETSITEIDCIMPKLYGNQSENNDEIEVLCTLFQQERKPHVISTKFACGNSIGASMAIEVAAASLVLNKQCLIPLDSLSGELYRNAVFKVVEKPK